MKVEGDMLENMRPKRPTLFIPLRADRRTQNLLFHVSIEQEPKFLLLDLEGKMLSVYWDLDRASKFCSLAEVVGERGKWNRNSRSESCPITLRQQLELAAKKTAFLGLVLQGSPN